jgi:hypothetical protein
MRRKGITAIGLAIALSLLITPAFGVSPQQNGNSENEILDVFKGQGKRSGLIKVNKTDLCTGDVFSVAVVLPSSLNAVWSGVADVQLIIRLLDGNFLISKLENIDPDLPFNLFSFELPEEGLPAGYYQFALILTNKGVEGLDSLDLSNWYNGFNGLISVKNVRIRVGCTNTGDNGEEEPVGDTEVIE